MLTNGIVTIWRHGVDLVTRMDTWRLEFSGAASVQADYKAEVSNGLKAANMVKIRIPANTAVRVNVGDKLVIGESYQLAPPDDALTVVHVANNCKGSRGVWHVKVVAA